MFKVELVTKTNSYIINWSDGIAYELNSSKPSAIIPDSLKNHLETSVDYKNNPVFIFSPAEDTGETSVKEEISDGSIVQDVKPKKIIKKAVE